MSYRLYFLHVQNQWACHGWLKYIDLTFKFTPSALLFTEAINTFDVPTAAQGYLGIIIIIINNTNATIMSAHIRYNLNTIFYTHVEQSTWSIIWSNEFKPFICIRHWSVHIRKCRAALSNLNWPPFATEKHPRKQQQTNKTTGRPKRAKRRR